MSKFYKYKGNVDLSTFGSKKLFLRDLQDIAENKIWATKIEDLNDPSEGLYTIDEYFKKLSIGLKFLSIFKIVKRPTDNLDAWKSAEAKLLMLKKNIGGIYSLSKTYNNEIMWSHYSNNHKGYCIEYEFDAIKQLNLVREDNQNHLHHFDAFVKVNYSKKTPEKSIGNEHQSFINFLSRKSDNWKYEVEYRLILAYFGKYIINPNIVKSITFGINCSQKIKDVFFHKLQHKDILFYEIERIGNTYKLRRGRMLID